MINREQIVDSFTANQKLTATEKAAILNNEKMFLDIATDIEKNVPCNPTRTRALNSLLEAKMLCSQAITHEKTHEMGMGKKVANA